MSDFFIYGSWEPLDSIKILPRDVPKVSTIGRPHSEICSPPTFVRPIFPQNTHISFCSLRTMLFPRKTSLDFGKHPRGPFVFLKNSAFVYKTSSDLCKHPRGAFFFLKNSAFLYKTSSDFCKHPRGAFFFLKNSAFLYKTSPDLCKHPRGAFSPNK